MCRNNKDFGNSVNCWGWPSRTESAKSFYIKIQKPRKTKNKKVKMDLHTKT